MLIKKQDVTFHDCCTHRTKSLCKLLRIDHKLYEIWLNFFVKKYIDIFIAEKDKERIENSAIISLMTEAIECFDGIGILHRQGAVNSTYPLLRKLMELNFQIKFILQSDTRNKALAFEAYYVSRKTKGADDGRNIYLNFAKYKAYKDEADKIFHDSNYHSYSEWYEVYDTVEKQPCSKSQKKGLISSIKKLCDEIGSNDIYDNIYNLISKNVHGIFARDRIKLDEKTGQNYMCNYREPEGIAYQSRCSNLMITEIYSVFCDYYEVQKDIGFLSKQFDLIKAIDLAEKQYIGTSQ